MNNNQTQCGQSFAKATAESGARPEEKQFLSQTAAMARKAKAFTNAVATLTGRALEGAASAAARGAPRLGGPGRPNTECKPSEDSEMPCIARLVNPDELTASKITSGIK